MKGGGGGGGRIVSVIQKSECLFLVWDTYIRSMLPLQIIGRVLHLFHQHGLLMRNSHTADDLYDYRHL